MKARKRFRTILVMVALCMTTIMALRNMGMPSVTTVDADKTWYTCTVAQATAGSESCYVKLTSLDKSPHFALKWFRLPGEQEKQMLAMASGAMTNGHTVRVKTNVDSGIFPAIETMHTDS